jgi:hypothetical protein
MSEPQLEQFEHMEPRKGAAQGVCVACQQPISDTYYEAAGRIFCAACRDAVGSALTGGSGAVRLLKALIFGAGAAAVSAVVWYAIVEVTHLQIGLIAIAVGFAVGGAVRYGAEHRGGWAYQTIAVLFTYLAIAASYVPPVIESFRAQAAEEVAQSADPAPAIDETLLLVGAIVLSLELPVLQATEGTGIIGVLIVGFALYEAWKINKRRTIAFSGPFRLQRTAGSTA